MELTTSYQKLDEKYLGNSYGDLYIRIYAKYSEQDIPNNRTKVQYQARAYFSGNYILDQQSSGNVKGTSASQVNFSKSSNYSKGETTLGTTEAWVTHNSDGTMSITASAYLSFPNWGWSGTASGTATLPNLHKPPVINTATMVETNSVLTALNVPNTTVVRYLSKKRITLNVTAFDGATLTYKLRHLNTDYTIPTSGYQNSNIFNVDYTQNDIMLTSNNKAPIIQEVKDSLNGTATDYLFVTINNSTQRPDGIPYTKPTIERATTSIKRKSGGGTTLTDNKAVLNFKGTFYKGNDVIGNNNNIQQIGYKIWEKGTTEPSSYTTLTPTISDGNITVSNLELNNLIYTKTYNYKIILKDRYDYQDAILDGTLPTGQSVWTEYKDRVDFLALTVGGVNPFEYSTSEKKVGKWIDGKPLYRVSFIDTGDSANVQNFYNKVFNSDLIISIEAWAIKNNTKRSCMTTYFGDIQWASQVYVNQDVIAIECGNSFASFKNGATIVMTIEYTKTTD